MNKPNTTLTLLTNVKNEPQKTWELVNNQLEPLRQKQFLTRHQITERYVSAQPWEYYQTAMFPCPVVVVGSGNMDHKAYHTYANSRFNPATDRFLNEPHYLDQDYFYDAPLELLPQGNKFETYFDANRKEWDKIFMTYSKDHAYYASVSFKRAISSIRTGFSAKQLATLREQIAVAKESGLKARYWDLPS
ncbi:hypothetical protein L207DRAFT_582542 [Hyaloscypha variabilis F]|uniref:Uncharacterized protein n=1 Tax=Hyaloscypha variabilis (strain UAMH 11265 / GT02V1 / F) TaxID=1149755 RepID=A0A2J6RP98_HYAVF|nr:hypothetical protein L207DRAFT_582542 [Hyaloscypha variabilis F]